MTPLARTAARRPVGVSIIFLAIALFGWVALKRLAVDLLPKVDVPRISITTRYEGVAPEEIETLITRPIEQATSTVEGVDRIEASSSEGLSRVQLQFAWGVRLDEALDDVRSAIDRVRSRLPEDADLPSIYKFDLSSVPVAVLGVTGTGDPRRLKYLAENDFSRALERVPGVASVTAYGGRDREIRVVLDAERLSALGITSDQVAQALARENQTVSAGDMRAAGREVVIRTAGEFKSLDAIRHVVVATRNSPIRVEDLGSVQDTIRRVRGELWIDGKPGIRMRVYKQSGANTVEVAAGLRAGIARVNRDYAGRAQLSLLMDSSEFIRSSVNNVQSSAAIGALLAGVILLIFLRSLRATLVVGTAIPLSILATFALMYFRGMTLNLISFGGLALGVGMLVDGAIVILENIYNQRGAGLSAVDAAIEGTREVGGAVVSGTLTTMAVFVPVVFVGGFAGVLFSEMALVVTFALLCSLVTALTLVPMLAAQWLARPSARSRFGLMRRLADGLRSRLELLERWYAGVVSAALAAPWAIVTAAVVLLASSAALVPRLGTELMPRSDEGRIDINFELPVGTPLETMSEVMRDAERRVQATLQPGELDHVLTTAGPETWWRPGGSHQGRMEPLLVPRHRRTRGIDAIETGVRQALRNVVATRLEIRQGTANILTHIVRHGEDRLVVEIRGHDLGGADALGKQVVSLLKKVPGVTFAKPDRELGQLERVLHVDRARAAELGLGSADIATAVETYVLGSVATRYRDQGDEFDIRVQLRESERERLEQLPALPIVAPGGRRVALGSLVSIEERSGPSSISRVNQERVLRVNAGTDERPFGDIVAATQHALGQLRVPEGFTVGLGGEVGEQQRTFGNLLIGILLAAFLVYSAMAVQFESVRHPLVVMLAVPFAFIGAVGALLVTGTTLNMNSILGCVVLVGIVVNNAIVLVDYTNLLRRERDMELRSAIVMAGSRRLRPILMTTLTTVFALVPLAAGMSEGSEIQAPLARVVIGGLMTSTLVTLLLVPCVYFLVERRRAVSDRALPLMVPEEGSSAARPDN